MIHKLFDNGDDVNMCVFDFSKAFDIANPTMSCAKLTGLGASPQVVGWDRGFLENNSFKMRINGDISEEAAASSIRNLSYPGRLDRFQFRMRLHEGLTDSS